MPELKFMVRPRARPSAGLLGAEQYTAVRREFWLGERVGGLVAGRADPGGFPAVNRRLDHAAVSRYVTRVIESFADKRTATVFHGRAPKGFPSDLLAMTRRKLRMLDAAVDVGDLRSPPGNRLEALSGSRMGQHSIRVNDQWRICFVWRDGAAYEVEFLDYHT